MLQGVRADTLVQILFHGLCAKIVMHELLMSKTFSVIWVVYVRLRFSWLYFIGFRSSGVWCCVAGLVVSDVMKDCTAFVFKKVQGDFSGMSAHPTSWTWNFFFLSLFCVILAVIHLCIQLVGRFSLSVSIQQILTILRVYVLKKSCQWWKNEWSSNLTERVGLQEHKSHKTW